jgi:hypothetical protein
LKKANKPAIDAALLEYLDRVFPDKCPSLTDNDRRIWADVGAREVVLHLKSLHQQQIKDALEAVAKK